MYNTLSKIILSPHFYIFFILFAFIMFVAPWPKYVSIAHMKIDGATHLLQNNLNLQLLFIYIYFFLVEHYRCIIL